jgi:hypothetical protein
MAPLFQSWRLGEVFTDDGRVLVYLRAGELYSDDCVIQNREFCLFVYCCMKNFSAIWRLSPLPVKELHIFTYA